MLGKCDKNFISTSTLKHKFIDIVFIALGFDIYKILVISCLDSKRRMLSTFTGRKRSCGGKHLR